MHEAAPPVMGHKTDRSTVDEEQINHKLVQNQSQNAMHVEDITPSS